MTGKKSKTDRKKSADAGKKNPLIHKESAGNTTDHSNYCTV